MSSPIDVTQPLSSLAETVSAVVAIGGAVLLVVVMLRTMQWLRQAVDEDGVPEHPDAHDVFVDDWTDFDPDADIIRSGDVEFHCVHCGWEAYEDEALWAYENEECTKCGEGM